MSFIIEYMNHSPGRVTAAAGLAVCEALETVVPAAFTIKWLNDIYIKDKKVCGILAEAARGHMILGVGVNIDADFPDHISARAGAIAPYAPNVKNLRERAAAALIGALAKPRPPVFARDTGALIKDYSARCFTIGQTVYDNGEEYTASGVDEDFYLILKNNNGERKLAY